MKALVYCGAHDLRWDDWHEQPPEAGEVIVNVRAVGICGSDLHGYTGESGRRVPPMIMGHEATGIVSQIGESVPGTWIGARVIVQPFVACGTCDFCQRGQRNLCRRRRFYGGNIDGAMLERFRVPVANLVPLPDTLDFATGTLTEPFAVALHAVRQAGDLLGKQVLIAGCGPIGLLTLVAARRAGAQSIRITDVNPARLEAARRLGADQAINVAEAALQPTPNAPDAEVDTAFDAVGITATLGQALNAVRPGGTVIALGGWRTVEVNLAPFVAREITLRGTFNFTPDEFDLARGLLADRIFDPACLITGVEPLRGGAQVFARLAQGQGDSIKVVLTHPD